MLSGVYRIINIANGYCYVGSSVDLKRRASTHQRRLRIGTHENVILTSAVKKYGIDKFRFEILESCDPRDCVYREQAWIEFLWPEYNVRPFAVTNRGVRHSDDTKAKIRAAATRARARVPIETLREWGRKGAQVAAERMTAEQIQERGRAGGAAALAKMSAEQRREWHRKGGLTSAARRREQRGQSS
jgi:group I intron endonuclease